MRTYNDQTKNEIEAREIIRKLHNDAGVLWNTLVDYIHHFIDVMQPAHVAKKPGLRAWENVFVKGGKGGDGFFWAEFLEIAKAIKNRMDNPSANDKIEIANNNTTITNISTKKPVRYSLSKFQDTILPIIHKPVLQRKGNVIFEEQLNWNQCLDALLDEKIDVALHNFPTALAFTSNPDSKSDIFFWPFFTFKGYALFLNRKKFKAYCKKNNYEATDFKDLEARHGKKAICDFLNSSKFILERYTDVEYVLKKFVEKQGCVWEDIEFNNLLPKEINEGKRKFKEDSYGDILCTNSLHVLDLQGRSDKFELIEKADKLTSHQNFNGLICTMDYYNDHADLVHELIITWFKCIGDNVAEWDLLKSE